ncbi:MAG: phosphatidylserine decarboxylase [Bacteroidetes bacterium]|nr:phosphatidylserine decarboxylase [Bacteroidota bacterium]
MKLPIVKEGVLTAGICLILALFCYITSFFLLGWLYLVFNLLAWVLLILSLFALYFYRDPERKILINDNQVLSPADGKIIEIKKDDKMQIVQIFMSPLDMHVQRAPFQGSVEAVEYKTGKFLPAFYKKAEIENEQNIIRISTINGSFEIKQIAGILARRIVCWINVGDKVIKGQRIGMIKLGSQVDLSLPDYLHLKVKTGDKVKAGITVIAEG